MDYRLLREFRSTFEGREYRHRASNKGDFIAVQLFEDLLALGRSQKLTDAVNARQRVVNRQNIQHGKKARRGDATFGEIIPREVPKMEDGFMVARGAVATIEIAVEMKVLAKAMLKQIDRVVGDLKKQVLQFKRSGGNPICIGIVGINAAPYAISYEGERAYRTDGRNHRHPVQEAREAERRLIENAVPDFDEFLILRYCATNDPQGVPPFSFTWVDVQQTTRDYGSILTRISITYERRF